MLFRSSESIHERIASQERERNVPRTELVSQEQVCSNNVSMLITWYSLRTREMPVSLLISRDRCTRSRRSLPSRHIRTQRASPTVIYWSTFDRSSTTNYDCVRTYFAERSNTCRRNEYACKKVPTRVETNTQIGRQGEAGLRSKMRQSIYRLRERMCKKRYKRKRIAQRSSEG